MNAPARHSRFHARADRARGAVDSCQRESNPSASRADSPRRGAFLSEGGMARVLGSLLAYAVIACAYVGTLVVCQVTRFSPRRPWAPTRRIVTTAAFFNTQWFLSHVLPLTRSGVEEVVVVTDHPLLTLDKVRFWCPRPWMSRLTGRAVSKFVCLLACGVRLKPDVFVGFHLFPGAISALIVARVLGRPACYQMTGGPTEIVGGGAYTENRLLGMLGRPWRSLERLAIRVVREFDLVVVRGSKARAFLTDRGVRSVTIITGSVAFPSESDTRDREYDLVFVGRLAPIKQPCQFVDIVATLRQRLPTIRAAVVGDGPVLSMTREYAIALGTEQSIDFLGQIQDVQRILIRSKIFILTSRSEGLSIAMAEAMAAGVVPVVADVGDLADLITDGVTGFLVSPDDVAEFARRAAAAAARRHTSVEVVTAAWSLTLSKLVTGYAQPSTAAEGGR